jgi:hypothetical protein
MEKKIATAAGRLRATFGGKFLFFNDLARAPWLKLVYSWVATRSSSLRFSSMRPSVAAIRIGADCEHTKFCFN